MSKKFLVSLILSVCSLFFLIQGRSAPAQSLEWFRTYGDTSRELGYSVQQTSDSGYVIAGVKYPWLYLFKTTASGDTVWTRKYNIMYPGYCVQQTSDSGYIIAADIVLVKTNLSGGIIWKRNYSLFQDMRRVYCVQQNCDGGYILVGAGHLLPEPEDVILIKTDSTGDTLWTHTYGGDSSDVGWSVQQTADGGFVIAGWTESFGAGRTDVYLIKTDSIGDTMWTRTHGGTEHDRAFSLQQTLDGGYIVAGHTFSYGNAPQVYLIKTDSTGDSLWTHRYGWSGIDEGYSVQQTYDSGYIVCGNTNVLDPSESDVYLIKTDPAGDVIWTRIFGGEYEEWGYSVQQTLDSGYIVVGSSDSYYSGDQRNADVYLIKVAPYQRGDANRDGCVNIPDIVYLINYLFRGGPSPNPLAAGDANYDEIVNSADVVYLINYLFKEGPIPP